MIPSLSSIVSRLRFRQLALLVALEEHGSLRRAADSLCMTQPGLTKALHEIETTFGMALFERSSRGVRSNELGRCVVRYSRLLHAELGQLREEMDHVLRDGGGRLAVGAITGALHAILISVLAQLRAKEPTLSIEVREGTSSELLSLVNEGRLDLALGRVSVAAQPDHFCYEALLEEQVAVAIGPGHSLAGAPRVSLAQLHASRWICYPTNMPLRDLLEREFREAGLPPPAAPLETSSAFATMLMLRDDPALIALMSEATMEFCEQHRIACRLPLELRSRHQDYGIVTRRGSTLSPAAILLAQALRRAAVAFPGGSAAGG